MKQLDRLIQLRSSIGTRGAVEYALSQRLLRSLDKLGLPVKGRLTSLHTMASKETLYARYDSSDLDVFEQIYVQEEYRPLKSINNVKLIVDCGGYVGYSGSYLLEMFPDSHLIAIEPDLDNFSLLRKNLSPYKDRATLMRAAVWSHKTHLAVSKGEYRDGREWAIQVREALGGEEASVETTDIGSLLDASGFARIDILKMDVEGAEVAVFSGNCTGWLNRVNNLAIELHGKECEAALFRALDGYRYELSRSGELTICKNIQRSGDGS